MLNIYPCEVLFLSDWQESHISQLKVSWLKVECLLFCSPYSGVNTLCFLLEMSPAASRQTQSSIMDICISTLKGLNSKCKVFDTKYKRKKTYNAAFYKWLCRFHCGEHFTNHGFGSCRTCQMRNSSCNSRTMKDQAKSTWKKWPLFWKSYLCRWSISVFSTCTWKMPRWGAGPRKRPMPHSGNTRGAGWPCYPLYRVMKEQIRFVMHIYTCIHNKCW